MADTHRSVRIDRAADGTFVATNVRGGSLTVGRGDDGDFTPTELMLSAIGACTGIDVDVLTSRRAQPTTFRVDVDGEKVRDDDGNRVTDLVVTFTVAFPAGSAGDAARDLLPEAVRRSHDRLCTVGRTVEVGTAIAVRIEAG